MLKKLLVQPTRSAVFSKLSFSTQSNISLNPEEIVESLDKHIIGQSNAKRCVAIAFRNRFRRSLLSEELQKEIMPANILMKGGTGIGKTEIARRIAKLAEAPFIKVEATRYTEVGIVGADTNQMIKDMLDLAIADERLRSSERLMEKATQVAFNDVLGLLKVAPEALVEKTLALKSGDLDNEMVDISNDVFRRGRAFVTHNRYINVYVNNSTYLNLYTF
jgi:ATP-dependent HslUV protease ATP-binding subunit HslU